MAKSSTRQMQTFFISLYEKKRVTLTSVLIDFAVQRR